MSERVQWNWKDVEPQTNQHLLQLLHGEPDGFIQVGPKRFLFPKRFAEDGPKYSNFVPRPDDTWIVTFPRSGTTLTQELVWLLSNKSDYKTAAEKPLTERFPFLEFESCVNKKLQTKLLSELKNDKDRNLLSKVTGSGVEMLQELREKRFIKTHLPLSLLHPNLLTCGAKVIYVARNPKDVASSYYHLHRLFKTLDFKGTFDQFWQLFQQDNLQWCPFWEHLNEAWAVRDNPNVLFLFYEDIQNYLTENIVKIDNFLGFNTPQVEITKLAQHLDIQTFRNNSSVNFENLRELGMLNETSQRFIRKGGQSCDTFSPNLHQQADSWIQQHLQKTTLRFPNYK